MMLCPNRCFTATDGAVKQIKRADKDAHLQECPNQLITCPICGVRANRGEMEKHNKESVVAHMSAVNSKADTAQGWFIVAFVLSVIALLVSMRRR